MSKILEPRTELLALVAATGENPENISRATGIPKTRIENGLRGLALTIDDLSTIKKFLCTKLMEKQGKCSPGKG